MLFHVYNEPVPKGYFINEPVDMYRQLLDADWLLWLLLPGLAVGIVVILMLAWHVHELPHHRANHKQMRQIELVSALTLLGLFIHEVWALALFIAYMDWQAVEDWTVKMLRRAQLKDDPEPSAQPQAQAQAQSAPEPVRSEPVLDTTPKTDSEHNV